MDFFLKTHENPTKLNVATDKKIKNVLTLMIIIELEPS